jgi:hypothetical protein
MAPHTISAIRNDMLWTSDFVIRFKKQVPVTWLLSGPNLTSVVIMWSTLPKQIQHVTSVICKTHNHLGHIPYTKSSTSYKWCSPRDLLRMSEHSDSLSLSYKEGFSSYLTTNGSFNAVTFSRWSSVTSYTVTLFVTLRKRMSSKPVQPLLRFYPVFSLKDPWGSMLLVRYPDLRAPYNAINVTMQVFYGVRQFLVWRFKFAEQHQFRGSRNSNPGRGKKFPSPKRRDRLWSPRSLLNNAYRNYFPGVNQPGREVNHEVKDEWNYSPYTNS